MEANLSAERESDAWSATGVSAAEVAAELARLHSEHQRHEHLHAAARTLNLVVAPVPGEGERGVIAEIDRLGGHSPARAIVLRDHEHGRLDAEVVLDCEVRDEPGRVGICHDRVVLSADQARLEHSDSLIAPLMVPELPVVAWLPDAETEHVDAVTRRADHLVTDSARAPGPGLAKAAALFERAPVHDLAWGRVERWRAAVAGAWDPLDRRSALAELREVEVRHGSDSAAEALLLGGWIAACTGLDTRAIHLASGGEGIQGIRFATARGEVEVESPVTRLAAEEAFVRALFPSRAYPSGYGEALAAARSLQEAP
jgi:glucose-6-phosphate dehydrogenase assembly protein OpcA